MVNKGDFFEVLTGTVQSLPGFRNGTRVIAKLPREDAPGFEQAMLVNDIKALKFVGHHVNVVKLLAQCIHKDPVMAVLALEENGALRNYIRRNRDNLAVGGEKLKVFIKLIQDVVNGMAYLDSLKWPILHRCVSVDHVLVSKDGVCKVSGFGFATDILEREEYERSQELEVTLRWRAPEQIEHHQHTNMSDVWSYGVLMWETFNYGVEPYADMDNEQIKRSILSGGMLGCPNLATDDLFDVMQTCWQKNPKRRPNFASLKSIFSIN